MFPLVMMIAVIQTSAPCILKSLNENMNNIQLPNITTRFIFFNGNECNEVEYHVVSALNDYIKEHQILVTVRMFAVIDYT